MLKLTWTSVLLHRHWNENKTLKTFLSLPRFSYPDTKMKMSSNVCPTQTLKRKCPQMIFPFQWEPTIFEWIRMGFPVMTQINPFCLLLFRGFITISFLFLSFSIISTHLEGTGSDNSSSWKAMTPLTYPYQYHYCWWPGDTRRRRVSRHVFTQPSRKNPRTESFIKPSIMGTSIENSGGHNRKRVFTFLEKSQHLKLPCRTPSQYKDGLSRYVNFHHKGDL